MDLSVIVAQLSYGPYISPWKVLPVLVVLLVWAKLLTWIDKDAEDAHLPRLALNSGFLGGLVAAFLIFLFLPGFIVAFAVFMLFFLGEVAAYLVLRNQKVGLADLGKELKKAMGGMKKKKTAKIE